MNNTTTYILKLEEEKYYVGKTNNIIQRLTAHYNGLGAKWTIRFKMIELIEKFDGDLEKEKTIEYMIKYGWQNVRGAGWTKYNLSKPRIFQ